MDWLETEHDSFNAYSSRRGVFGPGGRLGVYSYDEDSSLDYDFTSSGQSDSDRLEPWGSSGSTDDFSYTQQDDAVTWAHDGGMFTRQGSSGSLTYGGIGSGSAVYSGSGSDSRSLGGNMTTSGSYTDSGVGSNTWTLAGREDYAVDQTNEDYALRQVAFAQDSLDETADTHTDHQSQSHLIYSGSPLSDETEHTTETTHEEWHRSAIRGPNGTRSTTSRIDNGTGQTETTRTAYVDGQTHTSTTTLPDSWLTSISITLTSGTPPTVAPSPPSYSGPSATSFRNLVDAILSQAQNAYNQPEALAQATDAVITEFTGVDADENGNGGGVMFQQVKTPPSGGVIPLSDGQHPDPRPSLPPGSHHCPPDGDLRLIPPTATHECRPPAAEPVAPHSDTSAWSKVAGEEIRLVKELNRRFGTNHTRLDAFTPEERARIEKAYGQKFDWDNMPIRGYEEELGIRIKVHGASEVSLKVAAVADAAAGALAVGSITGVTQVGNVPILGPGGATSAIDANKLIHIFGKAAHNLAPLVSRFGSQEAAYLAVQRATQAAVTAGGITGKFEIVVAVGGINVTVCGIVIDGIARIGTFFIR